MRGFRRLTTSSLGWVTSPATPYGKRGYGVPPLVPHGAGGRRAVCIHFDASRDRSSRGEAGRASASPALPVGDGRDHVRRIAAQAAPPHTDRRFDSIRGHREWDLRVRDPRWDPLSLRVPPVRRDALNSSGVHKPASRGDWSSSPRGVDRARRSEVARETFETFWLRLLEEKRPYMTEGSAEDFQAEPSVLDRRALSRSSSAGTLDRRSP
jgi:hypothetical protein